ncbi:SDR family oxidoreductase [Solihabitans fulvus]|uniref:SDR family oxidoreductase n=1 Tax=Solihabitans fulvus TaxID=1892852 RepID=A0A5B2XS96_9PSEU|nr:SDR family oxidoreductase [Solihabitans fulvus]KAA2265741.1 SDR family oxidoreductase [Solihabitans fulvus]
MTLPSDRPVALVTGANRGIGKEIARGLARAGMTVLLGSRDPERGVLAARELAADGVVFVQLVDVTDPASVTSTAQAITRRFGRLDVLVNNAGIAQRGIGAPSAFTAEHLRVVYETNVFGVVTMMHTLLPLLRLAPAARVVNVSSTRGSLTEPSAFGGQPNLAYSTSKTALNALTVHYARELADTPIKVNAASPGHVATDFNDHTGTRTPEQGAAVVVRLATLPADGPTGGFFNDDRAESW